MWRDYLERGRSFGVIMVDIDRFKAINDSAGHAAGDRILQELTRRLGARLRRIDALGRYGGEEFLIIVQDTSRDQLVELAERLRSGVAESPFDVAGGLTVTASFGAAEADSSVASAAALVERADQGLYRAKALGRNRVGQA